MKRRNVLRTTVEPSSVPQDTTATTADEVATVEEDIGHPDEEYAADNVLTYFPQGKFTFV